MKSYIPTFEEFIHEDFGHIMSNTATGNKTFISSGSGVYSISHQFAQQVRDLKLQIDLSDDDDEIDNLEKQVKELEMKIKKEN